MFGNKIFVINCIIILCFLTVSYVESARRKKDVHHMIILNEDTKPSKSHRYKHQIHHHHHSEEKSKKSRKKPGKIKVKDNTSLEDSYENSDSYEEIEYDKGNSKRHPQRNVHHHHKRQNNHRNIQQNLKLKQDLVHKNLYNFPYGKWTPVNPAEIFETGHVHNFKNNAVIYHVPTTQDVTTAAPVRHSSYIPESSGYPAQSFVQPQYNMNLQKSTEYDQQIPLFGTGNTYKPHSYSIMKNTFSPSGSYQSQTLAHSDVVTEKNVEETTHFSIIVEDSDSNVEQIANLELNRKVKRDPKWTVPENNRENKDNKAPGRTRYQLKRRV